MPGKKYYWEHRERILKRQREYYWKSPERHRQYCRKYREKHLQEKREYLKKWRHINRKRINKKNRLKEKARRIKLILMKGGKCEKCGLKYDGQNGAIFVFHHRNPEEKNFRLSVKNMYRSWESIIKELEKCDLFCMHCHTLLHWDKY